MPALFHEIGGVGSHRTSLAALIPPVGLLGAIAYYQNGSVNIRYAGVIAAAMFVGAYCGARIMIPMSPHTIRRVYGVFLLLVAIRMLSASK